MKRFRFTTAVTLGLLAGTSLPGWAEEDPDQPPARPAPEEVFKNLDANADGKLVADEISEEQQRFFNRLLRVADKDENGEVSNEEFLAAMKKEEFRPMPPREGERGPRDGKRPPEGGFNPGQMFDRIDQDKDGSISVEEAPERVKPMLERLLKKGGKDAGASLTKAEFLELVKDFRPGGIVEGGPRPEGLPGRGPRPEGAPGEGRGPGGFRPGRPPMPRFLKELDTDEDGKLSQEELSRLTDIFATLDENEDGLLDARELMGPPPEGRVGDGQLNRVRGPGIGPGNPQIKAGPARVPSAENMLKRFDKDGDGKLSSDEVNEHLKKRFAKIDTNGDGVIDRDELGTMLEKRAKKQAGKKPATEKKPAKEETK